MKKTFLIAACLIAFNMTAHSQIISDALSVSDTTKQRADVRGIKLKTGIADPAYKVRDTRKLSGSESDPAFWDGALERMQLGSGNGWIGIGTNYPLYPLDIFDTDINSDKARLATMGTTGFNLFAKAYNELPVNCKSFSLEMRYCDYLNSAINFYRGDHHYGGFMTFAVNDGTEIAKMHRHGLDVYGKVHAQEVEISLNNWADYVFADDYELPSLQEVKSHIEENKRLPGLPSEAEVLENGVGLGEMQVKLLQKIEELTLYVIKQQEMIEELQKKQTERP